MNPNQTAEIHWHVATGFSGYGPDGSDGYLTADDVNGAADLIRSELSDEIDGLSDTAQGYADSGDFESAWKSLKVADSLEIMRANLSSERANAPVYRDVPGAWVATLTAFIERELPLALDINASRSLYAWRCGTPDCDHATEEE